MKNQNHKRVYLFFILLVLFTVKGYNQKNLVFKHSEDSINNICQSIIKNNDYKTDSVLNSIMIYKMRKTLELDSSFYYNFSFSNYISVINSEDLLVKIFTWPLITEDFKYTYFGFIQFKDCKTNKIYLLELLDKSDQIKAPHNKVLNSKNWFGAQYYKIITVENKGKKFYTLLGWNGKDAFTNYKIIDVLSFDNKNVPTFGATVFEKNNDRPVRVIFEYSEKTTMALRFEKQQINKHKLPKFMIIFDRLLPSNPSLNGQFQFYFPETNIFDAFVLKQDKWIFTADVDARNRQMEQQKQKKQKSENLLPHK